MANANKVILIGNLTRDIELRHIPSGKVVGNTGMATTRCWGDNQKTVFVDLTMWGKKAENAERFLEKGSQVYIEGELDFDTWDSQGSKRSKLSIVVQNIVFLNRLKQGGGEQAQWNPPQPQPEIKDPTPPTYDDCPF